METFPHSQLQRSFQNGKRVGSRMGTEEHYDLCRLCGVPIMPRDWCLPLTYLPKIEPVKRGECTQTIRFCTISKSKKHPGKIIRKQVGDRVRFYIWSGRPYWSHPEYITEYMVLDQVDDIQISPGGIKTKIDIDVLPWNHGLCELLANLDFIDPPTGEALRDVLIGKNSKIPAEGAPAQILRWKP